MWFKKKEKKSVVVCFTSGKEIETYYTTAEDAKAVWLKIINEKKRTIRSFTIGNAFVNMRNVTAIILR